MHPNLKKFQNSLHLFFTGTDCKRVHSRQLKALRPNWQCAFLQLKSKFINKLQHEKGHISRKTSQCGENAKVHFTPNICLLFTAKTHQDNLRGPGDRAYFCFSCIYLPYTKGWTMKIIIKSSLPKLENILSNILSLQKNICYKDMTYLSLFKSCLPICEL